MNIHDTQHDRAPAQQIIKALALPVLSRAYEPPRPMPLSHLPRLPRETSMLYTIGRVDRSDGSRTAESPTPCGGSPATGSR